MKLKRGERSLLATFESGPQAEKALHALQQAGYTEAQLDRIGRFGYSPDSDRDRPVFGKATSLSQVVLNKAPTGDVSRPLMVAMPQVSGATAEMTMDNTPFLVTVVTHQERLQDAIDIIHENGGRV